MPVHCWRHTVPKDAARGRDEFQQPHARLLLLVAVLALRLAQPANPMPDSAASAFAVRSLWNQVALPRPKGKNAFYGIEGAQLNSGVHVTQFA